MNSLLNQPREEIDVALVLSSKADAQGLARARRHGVPTMLVPKDGNKIDWAKLTALLRQHRITHIVLAGFMKIVPKSFVAEWRGHLVNLHPSLLPSYPGLDSISRAIQDGAPLGATVHEVDEGVDSGRVICMRKTVPVDSGFSPWFREFLVHVDEQRLLPFVVRSF